MLSDDEAGRYLLLAGAFLLLAAWALLRPKGGHGRGMLAPLYPVPAPARPGVGHAGA